MGLGCSSSDFLQSAFLTLPVETRRRIRDDDEGVGISIGDYLLWAVAYKMISKITYCANPNGDKNDYVWDTVKVTHQGDSGSWYVRIGKDGEEPIFYGNTYDEFENFTVEIQEDGTYEIICKGWKAKGNIEFEIQYDSRIAK